MGNSSEEKRWYTRENFNGEVTSSWQEIRQSMVEIFRYTTYSIIIMRTISFTDVNPSHTNGNHELKGHYHG